MQKRNRRPPGNELVTIRRISSGGEFEARVGYCRAVVAGGFVHVAGTTAQGTDIPDDAAGQCASALMTIRAALETAGSGMEHVVRVTYMLPDRHEFAACWSALKDAFGEHPPAATMIECGLIDPKYRIEIEVTALLPG
ncbi:MAG: RidA family protein [Rhodobacteraceae bacterium]|nr:RidA family protein [Paracoccaceae bacterium]